MSEYRITLTKEAKEDILDIGDYITHTLQLPDTSISFIKGLRKSISHLKTFPSRFPLLQKESLRLKRIHCMPYRNYYIFYQVLEQSREVIILRVGYSKRNWIHIL